MIDYKTILEELGYKLKDHGSYWRTSALYRSGDNSTALQIYKDTGVWKDFVEDSFFLPFEALLRKTLNTNDNVMITSILKNKSVNDHLQISRKTFLKEEKSYNESCLEKLLPHLDFYLDKGVRKETLNDFKCGLAMSGKMYQRIVFPIFRSDGRIHGFSGRKVTSDERPKWLHSGRASDWFYPFYSIEESMNSILEKKSVHIVESIGDCISLYDSGVKNVLVSFGLNISPKFVSRLNAINLNKVFVSFNNDASSSENRGFQGSTKAILKLNEVMDFERIYFAPPEKNDFGEMNRDEIKKYVEYCDSLDHNKSTKELINFAEGMKDNKTNKSFVTKLQSLKKKYNFYYG